MYESFPQNPIEEEKEPQEEEVFIDSLEKAEETKKALESLIASLTSPESPVFNDTEELKHLKSNLDIINKYIEEEKIEPTNGVDEDPSSEGLESAA